ncbi:MAG: AmmeMemoRadiSam system protein B [Ignavibacteriales bacterium]|nr:AmmeMemoRadiSam system protein B [Ignavibacteriales bacterium]
MVELSNALLEVMDDDTLVVASSDLSHFYPKPVAHKLDSVIADRIVEYDPVNLEHDLEKQLTHACVGGLVVALMKATKRAE